MLEVLAVTQVNTWVFIASKMVNQEFHSLIGVLIH